MDGKFGDAAQNKICFFVAARRRMAVSINCGGRGSGNGEELDGDLNV